MKVDRKDVKETGKVLGKEWRQETHVEERKAGSTHKKKRRQETHVEKKGDK
jgi:hypothetical protein